MRPPLLCITDRTQCRRRSVSALQWLCNADKKDHNPKHRLNVFFQSLYNCLVRGARAVLQFYPADGAQLAMISDSAMRCVSLLAPVCPCLIRMRIRCGFTGGTVIDFPNSAKAKKCVPFAFFVAAAPLTARLGTSSYCLQAAPEHLRRCPRLSVRISLSAAAHYGALRAVLGVDEEDETVPYAARYALSSHVHGTADAYGAVLAQARTSARSGPGSARRSRAASGS